MAGALRFAKDWSMPATLLLALLAVGPHAVAKSPTVEISDNSTAERLIDEARQAELAGDTARQFSLLREAVRVAPDFELARWQLGQIRVGDEWATVEETQRDAAADPKQVEYAELRHEHGESPAGQLALARWCRKNGLIQEAEFHWQSVLSVRPNNEEALRALNMTLRDGRPMTQSEVAVAKEQVRASKRATKRWSSTIAKWRRAIDGSDAAARNAALGEIRTLKDVDAIPALEAVTLGRDAVDKHQSDNCRQISLAFIAALGELPAHAATESLVRHAVLSPSEEVRSKSIENLKLRPLTNYVPLLLGGLQMPIESAFSISTDAKGSIHYRHSLYREGAERDWSFDGRLSAIQHNLGGRRFTWDVATQRTEVGPPVESEATLAARKSAVVTRYQNRYGNLAAAAESQVQMMNQAAESLNIRILPVLIATTGKELGDNPKGWWNWWRGENDYHLLNAEHPVDRQYYSDADSYYYGEPTYDVRRPAPPPGASGNYRVMQVYPGRLPTNLGGFCECFAKGTLVWTKTGQRPIETVEVGDFVLSQDVASGELAYKPVIGRTVRPPSPILRIAFQREALSTTKGHPLWVAGVGWRMAKELGDGAILHSVSGAARVEAVEELDKAEAYNLVVADFNTYFVGESGILVHDNTPRSPTQATIPGLAATAD